MLFIFVLVSFNVYVYFYCFSFVIGICVSKASFHRHSLCSAVAAPAQDAAAGTMGVVGEGSGAEPLRARWWGSLAIAAAWLSLLPARAHSQRARQKVRRALRDLLGEGAGGGGTEGRKGEEGKRSNGARRRSKRRNISEIFDVSSSPPSSTKLQETVECVRRAVDGERIRIKAILRNVTLQQLLKVRHVDRQIDREIGR